MSGDGGGGEVTGAASNPDHEKLGAPTVTPATDAMRHRPWSTVCATAHLRGI